VAECVVTIDGFEVRTKALAGVAVSVADRIGDDRVLDCDERAVGSVGDGVDVVVFGELDRDVVKDRGAGLVEGDSGVAAGGTIARTETEVADDDVRLRVEGDALVAIDRDAAARRGLPGD